MVLLAALIVPPLVSISRYKGQITHLISASLGRPVRLASVEARLLPRPGFVLTDLTVDEDPEYGAEPVLHANTVTASIGLLPLWRGRLEIGRISVDEASVNLVRSAKGHWNMEPLFRNAAQSNLAGGAPRPAPLKLPYLEATNSRINLKNGIEKLPFSLVNTDLSFWQDGPGDWRIRLRGQPARTDVAMDLGDTGIVRLEGSLRRAPELRQMPVHMDLVWREAQLGQLSRLIVGSDPGWRGDLTGELHLDGTAESAQIKTRLRAEGVHRVEFTPPVSLDFDANCAFAYQFFNRSLQNLACDSPLGNGRIHLAGDLPGGGRPHLSVQLDRIPAQAGLDLLRTVRSGVGAGLQASGAVSGQLAYAEPDPASAPQPPARKRTKVAPVVGPLSGSLTLDGFELRGGGLSSPLQAPKIVLTPVDAPAGQPQALAAAVSIPVGAPAPLAVTVRLSSRGYQIGLRGQAAVVRARELAHLSGIAAASMLDAIAGDPLGIDLSVEGPWIPAQAASVTTILPAGSVPAPVPADIATDRFSGTVTLHKSNWKADFLASPLTISQATLHLDNGQLRWDPVEFSYGPVKGTATVLLPPACVQPCAARAVPTFTVDFGSLDAAVLQTAFLGANKPGTLLSTLIARIRPAAAPPAWPRMEGAVRASSLLLGPVRLENASATVRTVEDGAEIASFSAGLLGGSVHGTGAFHAPASAKERPSYSFNGAFEKLNPQAVGQLVGQHWSGGTFDGNGKIELAGYTDHDLATSANGSLHFDWRKGSVAGNPASVPPALARFDRWTATLNIANGVMALKENQVEQAARSHAVEGSLNLSDSPRVSFDVPKETRARR